MHAAAQSSSLNAPLRTLLRSLGQIVLQENAFTGACLIAAWLLSGPRLACAALIGAIAANVSAILAGSSEDETRAGLHGFNGALAGLAAFSFIADPSTAAAVAILASTGTAWLLQPWSRWLRERGLGCFSSPCLIVTWLWLPFIADGSRQAGPLAFHAPDAVHFGKGVLAGFAQTGFASGALAGSLVLLGIAAASRKHALYALTGAGFASAAHLLLGASPGSFDAGLSGFNGVLTAVALADAGFAPMLGGVAISVLLQAGAVHFGWPAMTAPFVLATWSVQWLKRRIARGSATHAAAARRITSN
ncbi:urea transporter [Paraburkholderia susongensis]|uniref:Urea transporter n=1 Tax=Paraburkholderia susongensis TaxID=1515439 RepID=A0A1X7LZH1_9BURK|nr:urea transporter [Paraburkholderia susongensis]SMG59221.1 urea transporter [Paraburkholderia susongensis]